MLRTAARTVGVVSGGSSASASAAVYRCEICIQMSPVSVASYTSSRLPGVALERQNGPRSVACSWPMRPFRSVIFTCTSLLPTCTAYTGFLRWFGCTSLFRNSATLLPGFTTSSILRLSRRAPGFCACSGSTWPSRLTT